MREVTVERRINASPEALFDAWLDAKALASFMVPGPGMTVPNAESDGQVGGKFLVVMKAGDQEIPHHGEYREIDRPNRLVFTWASPFTQEDHLVTITFDSGDDGTLVRLHHTGFDSDESRDNHANGWAAILEALQGTISRAA